MADRYSSSPRRLSSVKVGSEMVLLNHDFWGKGAGGGLLSHWDSILL